MSVLLHAIGFMVFAGLCLIVSQDIQIFPGAFLSLFSGRRRDPKSLPFGVESIFIDTADGERIEVWRLPAEDDERRKPYIGLALHGNGGSLKSFFLLQLWFQELGITSYAFDYRGFGKSSGWPSEEGIYQDSDAVWKYILEREEIDSSAMIILGFSVGSAPAARLAALHQPKLLVLVSPFTSVCDVIRRKLWFFAFLLPFCRYLLPTNQFVKSLKSTPLILLHSGRDRVVPSQHAVVLEKSYSGGASVERLCLPKSDHNMVFYAGMRELSRAVARHL